MKKFYSKLLLFSIATFSLCLSSCSDKDKETDEDNLVGYWIESTDDSTKLAYQFNKDGSGTAQYTPNGRLDKFTKYQVKNSHLLLKWEGDDEYDDKGTIKINGDAFDLNLYDDEWMTFTRQ